MARRVNKPGDIRPGDFFEDCAYHPCLCTSAGFTSKREFRKDDVEGISLVDGRIVNCSIRHCGLRKLTLKEAIAWKLSGPKRIPQEIEKKWWKSDSNG
jgi:hypothetical protein